MRGCKNTHDKDAVMAGLVPAIHVPAIHVLGCLKNVDARDKPGHDD
jgi:hypothetical protein